MIDYGSKGMRDRETSRLLLGIWPEDLGGWGSHVLRVREFTEPDLIALNMLELRSR